MTKTNNNNNNNNDNHKNINYDDDGGGGGGGGGDDNNDNYCNNNSHKGHSWRPISDEVKALTKSIDILSRVRLYNYSRSFNIKSTHYINNLKCVCVGGGGGGL